MCGIHPSTFCPGTLIILSWGEVDDISLFATIPFNWIAIILYIHLLRGSMLGIIVGGRHFRAALNITYPI